MRVKPSDIAACLSDVESLRSKQRAGMAALTSAVVGIRSAAAAGGLAVNASGRCGFERRAGALERIDIGSALEGEANIVETVEEAMLDRVAQFKINFEI